MNRLTPLDRPTAPWWSLVVATVFLTIVVVGCVALIAYDLGTRHGMEKAAKAWECDKRPAGVVSKIGYPNGTVKCVGYAQKETK